jgi:hypothetical protein
MLYCLQHTCHNIFFVTGASLHYAGFKATDWSVTEPDAINPREFSKIKYFG